MPESKIALVLLTHESLKFTFGRSVERIRDGLTMPPLDAFDLDFGQPSDRREPREQIKPLFRRSSSSYGEGPCQLVRLREDVHGDESL